MLKSIFETYLSTRLRCTCGEDTYAYKILLGIDINLQCGACSEKLVPKFIADVYLVMGVEPLWIDILELIKETT